MEQFLTQQLPSLGIGGILGLVIFWFYRQDRLDARERWMQVLAEHDKTDKELIMTLKGLSDLIRDRLPLNRP